MMVRIFFAISLLCSSLAEARRNELEFTAAASTTTYEDSSDYNEFGITARFKYNRMGDASGWRMGYFLSGDLKRSILGGTYTAGIAFRDGSSTWFEVGAGPVFSILSGFTPGGHIAIGTKLSSQWFVTLPVYYRGQVDITPFVGYQF